MGINIDDLGITLDDYKYQVRRDAIESLKENYLEEDDWGEVFRNLLNDDSITGLRSNSYDCSAYKAKLRLCCLIWDEELSNLFEAHGHDYIPIEEGPERVDCLIRLFILENLYTQLLNDWDQLRCEKYPELKATLYLVKKCGLIGDDAKWLIDWVADEPMKWAKTYAPYIDYLDSAETIEEHEKEYPNDHVFDDAELTRPIVISEVPLHYF